MTPRVWVFAHCRNEAQIGPWWVRHYAAFADRIIVLDDDSDDGTPEILRVNPKVEVRSLEMGGLHEDELLKLAYDIYREAEADADWVIWPDMDEFIYHVDILGCLAYHRSAGHQVIRTLGFNMMGTDLPNFPSDESTQLTDLYRTGVRAPVYSKSVIIDPKANIQWTRGKHSAVENGVPVSPIFDEYRPQPWVPKLLHYRYLTPEYTRARNARQFERSIDKNAAWSNAPDHTGEHTPEWVARTIRFARDVVVYDACYLGPGWDA